MNKPFLQLSTRDFLTGMAPTAHSERGGLWYLLQGVTPAFDPGGSSNVDVGLLQATPAATDLTASVIVDTPFASCVGYETTTPYLYVWGDAGHLYRITVGAGTITDLQSGSPVSNPANGMFIYQARGGTQYLYYMQKTQVGRYALDGSTFVDNHNTDAGWVSTALHPTHRFLDVVYIGNGYKMATLRDNGAGGVTFSTNDLDLPQNMYISAICNDGFNVVIAATENVNSTDNFSDTRIFFWDGYSSSWQREYRITEKFITSIVNVGPTVYALGQYGVYELSFNAIPRKIVSRNFALEGILNFGAGIATNRMALYNQNAVMFGAQGSIFSIGKLSEDLPNALLTPYLGENSLGLGGISLIESQFEPGILYVGGANDKLIKVNLASGATRQAATNCRAQTVYIPLKTQYNITAVELVFGEPLVSGDSITLALQSDSDTTETTWNTWAFSTDGAVRRKRKSGALGVKMTTDVLRINMQFTGGAVKLKKIEVYGDPITS